MNATRDRLSGSAGCAVLVTALLGWPGTSNAALVPAGPELAEYATPPFAYVAPSACSTGPGEFVLAWSGPGGPFVQRLSAQSETVGSPIVVSTTQPGMLPDVACAADGSFVVVWEVGVIGYDMEVFAQRFDASAVAQGSEIHVNASTADDPAPSLAQASVSIGPSGEFVVAWAVGVNSGVHARRFDSSGTALGPELVVDPGPFGPPDVSHAPGGNFTIVSGATGQRYDAAGLPDGAAFAVPGENFEYTRVCHDGAGNSVVVGELTYITGQRYDSAGAPAGAPFVVEAATGVTNAELACAGDGSFVVAYIHSNSDGQNTGLRAQYFDASATPIGPLLAVNENRIGFQGSQGYGSPIAEVALSADGSGHVLGAWVHTQGVGEAQIQVRRRMFCDETEPGCVFSCPGISPVIDPDADGIPSGCDPCTNDGGAQDFVGRATTAVANNPGGPVKFNTVRLKGRFALPGGVDFASLGLDATGARLLVDSQTVGAMLDVELPGGTFAGAGTRGWKTNSAATQWTYADKTASPIHGITRVTVRAVEGSVQVAVKGHGSEAAPAYYPAVAADIPPRIAVVLGGQAEADAGVCGEVRYVAGDCSFVDWPFQRIRCRTS